MKVLPETNLTTEERVLHQLSFKEIPQLINKNTMIGQTSLIILLFFIKERKAPSNHFIFKSFFEGIL